MQWLGQSYSKSVFEFFVFPSGPTRTLGELPLLTPYLSSHTTTPFHSRPLSTTLHYSFVVMKLDRNRIPHRLLRLNHNNHNDDEFGRLLFPTQVIEISLAHDVSSSRISVFMAF
jgi:hypothetical protein